jgi:lysyl-tRNA synthetase class II
MQCNDFLTGWHATKRGEPLSLKKILMKHLFISIGLLMALGAVVSCNHQKKAAATQAAAQKEIEVTGEIIKIENGKDGYMATVKDKSGTSYLVTISMINLQKSGGSFNRFEVGQIIKAKGTFWKDHTGNTYITAKSVAAAG